MGNRNPYRQVWVMRAFKSTFPPKRMRVFPVTEALFRLAVISRMKDLQILLKEMR
jgi:hypothetical protein